MARQRKANADQALQSAILAFWKLGYHGLGTRQLEQETGITRFTLQTSYGGKKALFLQALDTYLDLFEASLEQPMQTADLDSFAQWFELRPVPDQMQEATRDGCLMINSILEFPRDDQDITKRAERFYAMMRERLTQALERIKANGRQVSDSFDVPQAVELLLAAVIAQNVSNKSRAPNAKPQQLMQATADMVRGWRQGA